jgi:hypothetical protein
MLSVFKTSTWNGILNKFVIPGKNTGFKLIPLFAHPNSKKVIQKSTAGFTESQLNFIPIYDI